MHRITQLLSACAITAAAHAQHTFTRPAPTLVGQGAAITLADVTGNGTPDMILVAIDGDMFNYRVYRDLQANGTPSATGPTHYQALNLPALQKKGAGAALVDLNNNGWLDLVMTAYVTGDNNYWAYRVAYDIAADGTAASWSTTRTVPGVDAQSVFGTGLAIAQLNGGRPDLIFMVIAATDPREFRYRVVLDPSNTALGSVSPSQAVAPRGYTSARLGDQADGADAAVAQLDNDPRPDLVLMHEDIGGGGRPDNDFRYKILWNLDAEGRANSIGNPESHARLVPGLGHDAFDSGFAIANLGGGPQLEVIYLSYDVGVQNEQFRFRVEIDALGVSTVVAPGCAGALGIPQLGTSGQVPNRGLGLRLHAKVVPPTAWGLLLVNTARVEPPLDLTPIGAAGCFLHVLPGVQLYPTGSLFERTWDLPALDIPGLSLSAQAFFANGATYFVTNPLDLKYGRAL